MALSFFRKEMLVKETSLKGCYIITPTVFGDERGNFFESFNKNKFEELTGIPVDFIQDNQSFSQKGVLRGLHFQKGEFSQAKLVRVIKGEVLDVVVDLRQDSETYGKHLTTILSGENNKQVFVPRGFAHGFAVLENDTVFSYKCDNFYHKEAESGILYNDTTLNIDWLLSDDEIILSEKDKGLKTFKELKE